MLSLMPVEILSLVVQELPTADLKPLALTSKLLRQVAAQCLWESIRVRLQEHDGENEWVKNFPRYYLKYVSKLHIGYDHDLVPFGRCPHHDDDKLVGAASDDQKQFTCLERQIASVLEIIDEGKLELFSWDQGSCLPRDMLRTLARKHAGIRTLRLSTDVTCPREQSEWVTHNDLLAFRKLSHLYWKGPAPSHLFAMANVAKVNARHLETLELNFVDSEAIFDTLGIHPGEDQNTYFWEQFVPLDTLPVQPLFLSLSVLSFSGVSLIGPVATFFDWTRLKSLTLRYCPGSSEFLEGARDAKCPIQLQSLEVQTEDRSPSELDSIQHFLCAFEGLEELYLATPIWDMAFLLWSGIASQRASLRRLILHHRDPYNNDICDEMDDSRLGLADHDIEALRRYRVQNYLGQLQLEYLGVTCAPEFLKPILETMPDKSSLKFLHIRQTDQDLSSWPNWAIKADHRGPAPAIPPPSGPEAHLEVLKRLPKTDLRLPSVERLKDEFVLFAKWAFGLQGLPSLQALAYGDYGTKDGNLGDFTRGPRVGRNNMFLLRDATEAGNFRLFHEEDDCWPGLVNKYISFLRPCTARMLATL